MKDDIENEVVLGNKFKKEVEKDHEMFGEQIKRVSELDPGVTGFNELLKDLEEDKFEQPLPASDALEKHELSGKDLERDLLKDKNKQKRISMVQQKAQTMELDAPEQLGNKKKL